VGFWISFNAFFAAFSNFLLSFLFIFFTFGGPVAAGFKPVANAAPNVFYRDNQLACHKKFMFTWLGVGDGRCKNAAASVCDKAYCPFSSEGPVTLSLLSWEHIFFQATWSSSLKSTLLVL
jgi:hypothetical protein